MVARASIELSRCVAAALVLALAWSAGPASGQRLNNGTLSCSAVPPSGGQSMSQALLSNLTNTQVGDPLNTAWGMQAPKHIDPLTPTIPQIKIGCINPELNTYCTFNVNGGNCYDVYADVSMDNVQNLSQLQFKALTVTSSNFKDVAAHSNRGPDASRITSGVFAPTDTVRRTRPMQSSCRISAQTGPCDRSRNELCNLRQRIRLHRRADHPGR
jgi:hypothetical protein